jgi:hypothetical protein
MMEATMRVLFYYCNVSVVLFNYLIRGCGAISIFPSVLCAGFFFYHSGSVFEITTALCEVEPHFLLVKNSLIE